MHYLWQRSPGWSLRALEQRAVQPATSQQLTMGKVDDATRVNQSIITLPTCCMPSITITTDSARFTTHYDIITTSCYGEPDVLLT